MNNGHSMPVLHPIVEAVEAEIFTNEETPAYDEYGYS